MEPVQAQVFAGVPKRYLGSTLPSLADQAARLLVKADAEKYLGVMKEVEAWVDSDSWCLVLHGPAGSGKSAIAAGLVAQCTDAPGWLSAAAYVDGQRDGSLDAMGTLRRARFLVLDDLGTEYATYFSNQQLDALVCMYYEGGGRLILTTNMAQEDVPKFYSERMLDRLLESSTWLNLNGPSFRRL